MGTTEYTAIPASRYIGAHRPAGIPARCRSSRSGRSPTWPPRFSRGWTSPMARARSSGWGARSRSAAIPPRPASGTPASIRRPRRQASGRAPSTGYPARRDAGHHLHDGGPPRAARHAPGQRRRDAVRFYVGFHQQADGIDGAYLHDPGDPHRLAAAARPRHRNRDRDARLRHQLDPFLAGSLYRSEADDRSPVSAATAIDADGMKAELIARLARAVSVPYS